MKLINSLKRLEGLTLSELTVCITIIYWSPFKVFRCPCHYPDFFIRHKNSKMYIEVKTGNADFSLSQIKNFMNIDYPVIIAIVEDSRIRLDTFSEETAIPSDIKFLENKKYQNKYFSLGYISLETIFKIKETRLRNIAKRNKKEIAHIQRQLDNPALIEKDIREIFKKCNISRR